MFLYVGEFWRSMLTMFFRWEPLLFRGAADVAVFSGYSLWLLTKSNSPAVREPQSLTNNRLCKLDKNN